MKIREIRITEPFCAELLDAELPDVIPDGFVRIRTEASAVSSGTELAVFTGTHQWLKDPNYPEWRFPFRSGYSSCGVIEAVGDGVEGLPVGTRVATNGNHASHVHRPAHRCWTVPDGVRPEVAAATCIARYGFGAAARVPTTMGRSVVVQGLGVIGQNAVRAFVAAGAYPIVGLDSYANRRETAILGGADAAFDPKSPTLDSELASVLGDTRTDIVADATGIPAAVPQAMALTRDGGQCVIVGSPRGLLDAVNFYPDMHKRCIEVLGAHGDFLFWKLGERLGWNVDKAMRWLLAMAASGRYRTDGLPSEICAPSDASRVYDQLLNDKEHIVSAVFDWSRQ
jgi:threonine dehydrogenase-like Zn-dependent dehydrogenase